MVATAWLITTSYLFFTEQAAAGYILGGLFISVAFTLSVTDFCLPSMIYNFIFNTRNRIDNNVEENVTVKEESYQIVCIE